MVNYNTAIICQEQEKIHFLWVAYWPTGKTLGKNVTTWHKKHFADYLVLIWWDNLHFMYRSPGQWPGQYGDTCKDGLNIKFRPGC